MAEQTMTKQKEQKEETWLSKQPLLVEAAVSTVASGSLGAAVGASLTVLAGVPSIASLNLAQFLLQPFAGGPLLEARNCAVLSGADAGISCVIRRFRSGREDFKSRVVASFGAAILYSLVSGLGGPHSAKDPFYAVVHAFVFAILFAPLFTLVRVGAFRQKSSQARGKDKRN